MTTLVHLHASPRAREDAPDCAPPTSATAPWNPPRYVVSDQHGLAADAPITQQLRTHVSAGSEPTLLLTGRFQDQLRASRQLLKALHPNALKTVQCIGCRDRPALFHRPAEAHGLILDNEPLEIERENWATYLGPDILSRVQVVAHRIPALEDGPAAASSRPQVLRHNYGLPDDETIVSIVCRRADPWLTAGMHAFALWSRGLHAECHRCRALTPDRFHPEVGRHTPRQACLYCGSEEISRGTQRHARLLVSLLDADEPAPHPEVMAHWLEIDKRYTDATDWPWQHVYQVADVSLVLNDSAFTDPLVYSAMDLGRTCVTNNRVETTPRVFRVDSGTRGWDYRHHVTQPPSMSGLVRALNEAAAMATRMGSDLQQPLRETADAAGARSAADWQAALRALIASPRTPRPPTRRRLVRPWRHGR